MTDRFEELRFDAKGSHHELVAVILLSFGALASGAGIYAQWFWRAPEPPGYAPFLLAGGIALIVVYAFYAPAESMALLVGELGVGVERGGKVSRMAWWELEQLSFAHGALVLKTHGKPLQVPLKDHPAAARLIVAEAIQRIPKRVDIDDEQVEALGPPDDAAGKMQDADAPQVTELFCRATDKPLTIERDVRMCGRCGALYHRKGVPRRCAECARKLRGA